MAFPEQGVQIAVADRQRLAVQVGNPRFADRRRIEGGRIRDLLRRALSEKIAPTPKTTADDQRMKDRMLFMILLEGFRDQCAVSIVAAPLSGHVKRSRPTPGARQGVKSNGMAATILAPCGEAKRSPQTFIGWSCSENQLSRRWEAFLHAKQRMCLARLRLKPTDRTSSIQPPAQGLNHLRKVSPYKGSKQRPRNNRCCSNEQQIRHAQPERALGCSHATSLLIAATAGVGAWDRRRQDRPQTLAN